MSCICLPLSSSFVCLAEITTRRWCSPRLYCVKLLSAHHVRPSRLLPLSLLHDWSFCHYFLAAGGDPGNLVNLLTTNCLLLPCCLDKQPGWGGGSEAPVTYKSRAGRGGSHCHCMDPSSPDFLHVYWDFWTLDFYLLRAQRPVTHLFFVFESPCLELIIFKSLLPRFLLIYSCGRWKCWAICGCSPCVSASPGLKLVYGPGCSTCRTALPKKERKHWEKALLQPKQPR